MICPVCGGGCVRDAREIIELLPSVFEPCSQCRGRMLNKQAPPPESSIKKSCSCGKRFIDDVFAHAWIVMNDEGVLGPDEPLARVGTPLIDPGFALRKPPYLPQNSLVLLSNNIAEKCAERLIVEVPEIKGIVRRNHGVPGLTDIDKNGAIDTYDLLAGCDVRANVFLTEEHPVVIYKQQSVMHIEFPRGFDPKIVAVCAKLKQFRPGTFVDACSGAGTPGIVAGVYGVPHVILNDAWFAAAFWSACNLQVNREYLDFETIEMKTTYEAMKLKQVVKDPVKIAETTGGGRFFEVYQADYRLLHTVLPGDVALSVIDLFEKRNIPAMERVVTGWKEHIGGEVFIP